MHYELAELKAVSSLEVEPLSESETDTKDLVGERCFEKCLKKLVVLQK